MKITGTEKEIDELVFELSEYSMANDNDCFFMRTQDGRCIGKVNCAQCIIGNNDWEASDEYDHFQ